MTDWPRYMGKTQALARLLAGNDLDALMCAVDVPQNRRPGSYFWNSHGQRVHRMMATAPRGARPRRLRPPEREW